MSKHAREQVMRWATMELGCPTKQWFTMHNPANAFNVAPGGVIELDLKIEVRREIVIGVEALTVLLDTMVVDDVWIDYRRSRPTGSLEGFLWSARKPSDEGYGADGRVHATHCECVCPFTK